WKKPAPVPPGRLLIRVSTPLQLLGEPRRNVDTGGAFHSASAFVEGFPQRAMRFCGEPKDVVVSAWQRFQKASLEKF
ncbi:hypothetical protein WDZ92_07165, partial [Nostoc sp. NIES-2111]